MGVFGQGQKVKIVGVFEDLTGKVGLRRRKRSSEIGDGLALPAVEVAVNLVVQNGPAPAVLKALAGLPQALRWVFHLFN